MNDIIAKTREDYNRIAQHFSDTRYDKKTTILEQFKDYIKNGQYILDWGCGNGRLLFLLQDFDIHYIGTDQSIELIKIAQNVWKEQIESGKAQFFCTEQEKHFPVDYFDLVFMIASFHHLPDTESRMNLLKKIYKEMKPGGKLIMTNWNLESDWAQDKLQKDWEKIGENDFLIPWKNQQGELMAKRYYHHFNKEELEDLLSQSGFMVEKNYFYAQTSWSDKKGGQNLITIASKP
jgi:SAM-dependent methyltransferase